MLDPRILLDNLPAIAGGLATTFGTWLGGAALGLVLGFVIALLRRFGGPLLRWPLRAYVEVIRGTPFLVQLFLLYYGGPFIGISLDPVPAGLLGLTLYGSAYFAETFRAGFEAVPRGQLEAGQCVGLTRLQIIRRIEIPQMLVVITPTLVNLVIILSKETAVLSIITVPELTLVVTAIGSHSYAFVEATAILALCYWGLVEGTAWLGRRVEARVGRYLARA